MIEKSRFRASWKPFSVILFLFAGLNFFAGFALSQSADLEPLVLPTGSLSPTIAAERTDQHAGYALAGRERTLDTDGGRERSYAFESVRLLDGRSSSEIVGTTDALPGRAFGSTLEFVNAIGGVMTSARHSAGAPILDARDIFASFRAKPDRSPLAGLRNLSQRLLLGLCSREVASLLMSTSIAYRRPRLENRSGRLSTSRSEFRITFRVNRFLNAVRARGDGQSR